MMHNNKLFAMSNPWNAQMRGTITGKRDLDVEIFKQAVESNPVNKAKVAESNCPILLPSFGPLALPSYRRVTR